MSATDSPTLDPLLAEIHALREATDLGTLVTGAAAAVVRLTGGLSGAAYIESGQGDPAFADAGQPSSTMKEARSVALARLAENDHSSAVPLADEPDTLTVSFHSHFARGALLAERQGLTSGGAVANVLEEYARQVSLSATALVALDSLQLLRRTQGAIVEAVSVGIVVVVEWKVSLLNCSGAQLLGVTPDAICGEPFSGLWPDLARAMERGQSLAQQPMHLQDELLSVTLCPILEGFRAGCAAVTFFKTVMPSTSSRTPTRMPRSAFNLVGVIGVSEAMARVRDIAQVAARSSSGLLIEGESGVGKEVLAQAIHAAGPRRRQPFVAVLCAAIPHELLESELFGYEAGSFTGASPRGRSGHFEAAQGGTLLLDDILDMPLDMQAKLLRVLQERVITRVGGSRPQPIDVRIIATSHPSLAEAVRQGRFRADLYYRLHVLSIVIPPLRERRQDIKSLAEHFLRKHAAVQGSNLTTLGAEALRQLEAHTWPGNARELEHWIESEIHFASPDETCLRCLTRVPADLAPQQAPVVRSLRDVERELYAAAMASAAGDVSRAARNLGISRGKLYRKLRLYEA
jgi:transcriptional regulator with PAS, ATPase and Fis domain